MFFRHRFLKVPRLRITAITILLIVCLILGGCAPKSPRVYRVGILSGLNYVGGIADGFIEEMHALGYTKGENIVYDIQRTDFDLAAYRRILHKFVADKVDLIFVYPTEATIEAKKITAGTNIPVVFSFVLIEDMNIVDSIREPGGNLTGVRFPGPDVALKRYEVMMELLPQAKTLVVPYQRGYPIIASQLAQVQPAAYADEVTLIEVPADSAQELASALNALSKPGNHKIDAILLLAEPLSVTADGEQVLCDFSYANKAPMGGALINLERCSSIFGINVKPTNSGKEAAPLADRILRGTKPADIPIVSSESFLQFNYSAARDFGMVIPEGLLKQADEVIP